MFLVKDGFSAKAKEIGVTRETLYTGPQTLNATRQLEISNELVDKGNVQGIAVSVIDPISIESAINKALDAGIPVITFDSDAGPNSRRLAYVGSNNTEFGATLAKTLLQLDPDGYQNGTYGIISGTEPNIVERYNGFQAAMKMSGSLWKESNASPRNAQGNSVIDLQHMYNLIDEDNSIAAIIPLGGSPMFNETGWIDFHNKYPHWTYVVADALDSQIRLMKRSYANSLVGQLPFEMGEISLQTLFSIAQGDDTCVHEGTILGTNLVGVLRVP